MGWFEDLLAWQKARMLTQIRDSVTKQGVFAKEIGTIIGGLRVSVGWLESERRMQP